MLIGLAIVAATTLVMLWVRRKLIAKHGRQRWPKGVEGGLTAFMLLGYFVGILLFVAGVHSYR
jgi:hypothetical protein